MFSSFPQYLLLAPSFTNVLNVYAFCNMHDVRPMSKDEVLADVRFQVSWGTKGSDKARALPSVSSKKTGADAAIIEDTTKIQEDVDAAFKETVTRALTKVTSKEAAEKPTLDDQNKTFRTRLVAFWMLTNAALAVTIENINGLVDTSDVAQEEKAQSSKQNIYFAVILYSTFALAFVRFVGVSLASLVFTRLKLISCFSA